MRAECLHALAPFRLSLPRRALAGRLGERLGRASGASLEFQDFRDYVPGDDLRHVDWRGYARTDQWKVRLYREEIAPHLDIVVDLSASMGSTALKERALRDLCAAFCEWTQRLQGVPRLLACGGARFDDVERIALLPGAHSEWQPQVPLRAAALRVVISDFLCPGDPGPAIRRLAAGAAHLYVIQLLTVDERDPGNAGAITLIDCEDGARLELELDARTIDGYRQRLGRLCDAVARAARGAGGSYALVVADEPARMFHGALLSQGIVEVG